MKNIKKMSIEGLCADRLDIERSGDRWIVYQYHDGLQGEKWLLITEDMMLVASYYAQQTRKRQFVTPEDLAEVVLEILHENIDAYTYRENNDEL